MRAVVTRVSHASVTIDGQVNGQIGRGFLVLLGIGPEDTKAEAELLVDKICNCRVFSDEQGKMNLNIEAVGGRMLVVSQFTLFADLKSRRPGFSGAGKPEMAMPLYEYFLELVEKRLGSVEHGEFGADMEVDSVNDGPVTLLFDSLDFAPKNS